MKRGRGCSAGRGKKETKQSVQATAHSAVRDRLSLIWLENGKRRLKAEKQQIIQWRQRLVLCLGQALPPQLSGGCWHQLVRHTWSGSSLTSGLIERGPHVDLQSVGWNGAGGSAAQRRQEAR